MMRLASLLSIDEAHDCAFAVESVVFIQLLYLVYLHTGICLVPQPAIK